jgi:RNA methyltransferase, TrmH family
MGPPLPREGEGGWGGEGVIRSPANPTLVFVRSLQRRDKRAQERAFVVEGRRAVADALAAGARPRLVLLREGSESALPAPGHWPGARVRAVAPRLFDALTDTVSPQGILAVFPFPDPAPPREPTALPLLLVLDRIRDPGNLGTLLRAAAGAGVDAVYPSPASVDPFNPKVVRAGMGAHFRLPLRPLDPAAVADLTRACPLRVVARADAPTPYDALDWRRPAALIVGSEADGVGPELAALATATAAIPLAPGVESLNAAVAGAVILFEAARQRRAGCP